MDTSDCSRPGASIGAGGAAATAASTCPRCGAGFQCGAQGPGPCACAGLALPPAVLASLRAGYSGCLCVPCLTALAAAAQFTRP